jgi:hypothetical protein
MTYIPPSTRPGRTRKMRQPLLGGRCIGTQTALDVRLRRQLLECGDIRRQPIDEVRFVTNDLTRARAHFGGLEWPQRSPQQPYVTPAKSTEPLHGVPDSVSSPDARAGVKLWLRAFTSPTVCIVAEMSASSASTERHPNVHRLVFTRTC